MEDRDLEAAMALAREAAECAAEEEARAARRARTMKRRMRSAKVKLSEMTPTERAKFALDMATIRRRGMYGY